MFVSLEYIGVSLEQSCTEDKASPLLKSRRRDQDWLNRNSSRFLRYLLPRGKSLSSNASCVSASSRDGEDQESEQCGLERFAEQIGQNQRCLRDSWERGKYGTPCVWSMRPTIGA